MTDFVDAYVPRVSGSLTAYQLLDQVVEAVHAEPLRLNMMMFVSVKDGDYFYDRIKYPECGTVGCIAGWSLILARGAVPVPRLVRILDKGGAAARLLMGLGPDEVLDPSDTDRLTMLHHLIGEDAPGVYSGKIPEACKVPKGAQILFYAFPNDRLDPPAYPGSVVYADSVIQSIRNFQLKFKKLLEATPVDQTLIARMVDA